MRVRCLFNVGAYFVGAALAAGAFSVRFVPEAYDNQTMLITSLGLFTNTAQSGPYRGAGRPEAAYFTERLIEHAARKIGMDPAEIRRRNLIPPSKLPYTTPTFWTYDSGDFPRILDQCLQVERLEGLCDAPARIGQGRQAARPRRDLLHRAGRHLQRPHGPALRPERLGERSSPAPTRTARDTPPSTPSWCTNGSASRSRPSASSRATPRRCRMVAAPMRRAARWSAATRSRSRPTRSSKRRSPWRPPSWKRRPATSSSRTASSTSSAPTRRCLSPTSPRRSTRRWARSRRSSASAWRRAAPTAPIRPTTRTARTCARWRSIPTPVRS